METSRSPRRCSTAPIRTPRTCSRSSTCRAASPRPTRSALNTALAGFPDAKLQTKSQFIDNQLQGLNTLLNLLYVLLSLSIVVSLFGIVNTLVLTVFERTRELGMLRAVGMSRRQVRRMIRHESVITALLGAAFGIPLGILLAALIGAAIDFGTFTIPVGTLIVFVIAAVIAGLIAAIWPAGAPGGSTCSRRSRTSRRRLRRLSWLRPDQCDRQVALSTVGSARSTRSLCLRSDQRDRRGRVADELAVSVTGVGLGEPDLTADRSALPMISSSPRVGPDRAQEAHLDLDRADGDAGREP